LCHFAGVTVGWFLVVVLATPGDAAAGPAAGPIAGIVFPTLAIVINSIRFPRPPKIVFT
jgi:hypothetical protein